MLNYKYNTIEYVFIKLVLVTNTFKKLILFIFLVVIKKNSNSKNGIFI